MKSGAINIDDYIGVEPEEQFDFLYTHFCRFDFVTASIESDKGDKTDNDT